MKRTIVTTAVMLMLPVLAAYAGGSRKAVKPVEISQTVLLYPQGQDAAEGIAGSPVVSNGLKGPEVLRDGRTLCNVGDSARIDLYFPKKPNGQMVVVCPGGGYGGLATLHEGRFVAEWMLERGISVAVLKYRMPNGHWEVPLTDVQNAFRYCRAHAGEWNVNQIGVMGFSAGGHLAATASNYFTDDITRPDFSILIYPVITMCESYGSPGTKNSLIGRKEKWDDHNLKVDEYQAQMTKYHELEKHFSLDHAVNEKTPVTFLAHSQGDNGVPMMNSISYFMRMKECGVKGELHIFSEGGHGWGFDTKREEWDVLLPEASRKEFSDCLEIWLNNIK